jgi:hypothetical protein
MNPSFVDKHIGIFKGEQESKEEKRRKEREVVDYSINT